jgi:processive 1,2-diacylglycerol beta-glucosyltransferase
VLVLTAEEGDGHYAAARAVAQELTAEAQAEVVVQDAYKGAFGRVVPFFSRDAYRVQLRFLPWSYGLEYILFTRFPPARGFARAGLAFLCSRPLMRFIRGVDPDLVVSTHPAITSVLGHLRASGQLAIPAVATITDLDAHPFWSHRGIDLHLVMHEACVRAVERNAGRDSARVVRPIVAPAFRSPFARAEAREALGLPPAAKIIVVSGGGWAVGDLAGAARAALAVDGATVVCLSGRDTELRKQLEERFAGESRFRVVGFTDRMPELLAAADALVDASVGLTCLEALTCGCPIVVYGMPPGHSRMSAKQIARLGLAQLALTPKELTAALGRAVDVGAPALNAAPSAASVIAVAEKRSPRRPSAMRRRLVAATAATVGALALGGWTFATPLPYPIVSRALGLVPMRVVHTQQRVVGVVVESNAPATAALARAAAHRGLHASFALDKAPAPTLIVRLRRLGDEVVPRLAPEKPTRLLSARRQLLLEARALRLKGGFYYLAPKGFTLADYVAARSVGGHPFAGAVRYTAGQPPALDDDLRPGAIVVLALNSASPSAVAVVDRLATLLHGLGLRPVPLSALVSSARSTATTA